MKYKIGDKVLIKTLEELENTEGVIKDSAGDFYLEGHTTYFVGDMYGLCGQCVSLEVSPFGNEDGYGVTLGSEKWELIDWMIKEKVETTVDRVIDELYIPEQEEKESTSKGTGVNITMTNNTGGAISTQETKTDDGTEIEIIIADVVKEALKSGKFDKPMHDKYGVKPEFAKNVIVKDTPEVDSSMIIPLAPKKQKVTIEYEADGDAIDLTKWLVAVGFDVDVVGIGTCFKIKACMEKEK